MTETNSVLEKGHSANVLDGNQKDSPNSGMDRFLSRSVK